MNIMQDALSCSSFLSADGVAAAAAVGVAPPGGGVANTASSSYTGSSADALQELLHHLEASRAEELLLLLSQQHQLNPHHHQQLLHGDNVAATAMQATAVLCNSLHGITLSDLAAGPGVTGLWPWSQVPAAVWAESAVPAAPPALDPGDAEPAAWWLDQTTSSQVQQYPWSAASTAVMQTGSASLLEVPGMAAGHLGFAAPGHGALLTDGVAWMQQPSSGYAGTVQAGLGGDVFNGSLQPASSQFPTNAGTTWQMSPQWQG
jgi:hypothetical protein